MARIRELLQMANWIDVWVAWASHHRWKPQQRFDHPTVTYALWLVLDGNVIVKSCGKQWLVSPDDAFLFPPQQERSILTTTGAELLSVGLDAKLFGRVDFFAQFAPPILWRPKDDERQYLEAWMKQIVQLFPPTTNPLRIVVNGLAQAIIGLCWQMLRNIHEWHDVGKELFPQWLVAVFRYVKENPKAIVAELSCSSNFSPAQFRRLFRQWTGLSPRAYLRSHRLALARQMVELTDFSVSEIANRCGFESAAHFSRTFKRAFGLPPSQYRKGLKEKG